VHGDNWKGKAMKKRQRKKNFKNRLTIIKCKTTAEKLKSAMSLMGYSMPENILKIIDK
jgi:hypothetical protein